MSESNYRPPGKKIGQGMLTACFIAGLAILTFYFDGFLGNQENPNQTPASSENSQGAKIVALEQNRQGHYVANGLINDVPVTFLLDTGATDVAVSASVAQLAQLEQGFASRAATANGIVNVFSTTIRELQLGNIVLENIDASITPSMPDGMILLGMSALRQIEFSQRGSTLTLRQTAIN